MPEDAELTKCREAWRRQRRVLNDCRSWLLGRLDGTSGLQVLAAIEKVLGAEGPMCEPCREGDEDG